MYTYYYLTFLYLMSLMKRRKDSLFRPLIVVAHVFNQYYPYSVLTPQKKYKYLQMLCCGCLSVFTGVHQTI